MRRGIPSTPRMCMGKKARLNPMNMTQKLHFAQPFVHHAPGHLRQPVVEAGEHREHIGADQHVVNVGDDAVGVV